MKKLGLLAILLVLCMCLCSCATTIMLVVMGVSSMGTHVYDDVEDYRAWEELGFKINFVPDKLDKYTVNDYSCVVYEYMDYCYEVLVDITVSAEQFNALLEEARGFPEFYEGEFAYAEGYYEIVYCDEYVCGDPSFIDNDGLDQVAHAAIDKIIYNPETLNIVYISFHAYDKNVYDTENIQYFIRFNIDHEEYEASLLNKED